jgi:hypothetical protein
MSLLKDTKLKGPIGRVYPIAIFFLYILVMIEIIVTSYQFPVYSAWLFGAMFIIVGTIQFIRSGLWVHLVLGILIGTCTWHSMAIYNTSIFSVATYLIHFVLLAMFIIFGWSVLFGHDKYESNARRLFKLASESLVDVSNGFTDRPYLAGKSSISNDELKGFARYLKSKKIAMPHFSEQGLYLMFSMGRSVLTNPDPQKVSYVLFSKSGNMTVHVSEFDYKQYHEKITFDQLCNSLGDVYKRFEKYWANGNERRILDEIRNV